MNNVLVHGHWENWIKEIRAQEGTEVPIILHIGMEKTGTKAIQTWLRSKRMELEKSGWFVPRGLGEINHRQISYLGFRRGEWDDGTKKRNINNNDEMKNFQDNIEKRLKIEIKCAREKGQKAIIISSELISSRLVEKDGIIRLLRKLKKCGAGRILIILFRRNPEELIESHHSTAVKYENRTIRNPPKAGAQELEKFGNQAKIQKIWIEAIQKYKGIDIDIYAYTKKTLIENSSSATIAWLMGCSSTLKEHAKKTVVNERLPIINMYCLLFLNKLSKYNIDSKRARSWLIDNPIGRIKYKLPRGQKRSYIKYYKKSRLNENKGLLIYSSWYKKPNSERT